MALPTYKTRGISYAQLPSIETADLKAGAAMYQSLNQKLDKLLGVVEKEGTAYAEQQAQKFAAQNPITQEQIDAANNDVGPIESFLGAFQGKGGTVYQEALQKAQGVTLAAELKQRASGQIAQIEDDALRGYRVVNGQRMAFTAGDAQAEIADLADGYYATVSAFNLQAGVNLKADLATKGNVALRSVLSEQRKKDQAANIFKIEEGMVSLEKQLINAYSLTEDQLEGQIDPSTGFDLTRDQIADNLMKGHLDFAIITGNSTYVSKIQAIKSEAAKQALLNSVGPGKRFADDEALLRAMRDDSFTTLNEAWARFTPNDKQELKDQVYNRITARADEASFRSKQLFKELEVERADMEKQIGMGITDPLMRQAYEFKMHDMNRAVEGELWSQEYIRRFANGEEGDTVASIEEMAVYRQMVREMKITPDDTTEMMYGTNGRKIQLSGKQKIELDNLAATVVSPDYRTNQAQLATRIEALIPATDKVFRKKMLDEAKGMLLDRLDADPDRKMTSREHQDMVYSLIGDRYNAKKQSKVERNIKDYLEFTIPDALYKLEYRAKDQRDFFEMLEENPDHLENLFIQTDDQNLLRQIEEAKQFLRDNFKIYRSY